MGVYGYCQSVWVEGYALTVYNLREETRLRQICWRARCDDAFMFNCFAIYVFVDFSFFHYLEHVRHLQCYG